MSLHRHLFTLDRLVVEAFAFLGLGGVTLAATDGYLRIVGFLLTILAGLFGIAAGLKKFIAKPAVPIS